MNMHFFLPLGFFPEERTLKINDLLFHPSRNSCFQVTLWCQVTKVLSSQRERHHLNTVYQEILRKLGILY